tara:strand:- start:359 stop:727 length:369 start_codon:yes stop_codon:yes gene_type:complete
MIQLGDLIMKFLIFILTSLFLFSAVCSAETWSCGYLYNNEAKSAVFERKGNLFFVEGKVNLDIIFENEKQINLHRAFSPKYIIYFAVILDKENKMFQMVYLEPSKMAFSDKSAIITGKCNIY